MTLPPAERMTSVDTSINWASIYIAAAMWALLNYTNLICRFTRKKARA